MLVVFAQGLRAPIRPPYPKTSSKTLEQFAAGVWPDYKRPTAHRPSTESASMVRSVNTMLQWTACREVLQLDEVGLSDKSHYKTAMRQCLPSAFHWKVMPGLGSWHRGCIAMLQGLSRFDIKSQAWNAVRKDVDGQDLKGRLKPNSFGFKCYAGCGLEELMKLQEFWMLPTSIAPHAD